MGVVVLHTFWSVKGGSGTTVVAASVAGMLARRGGGALLVDLGGDQPATLGMAEPSGPGVRDWLHATERTARSLERLAIPVDDRLRLIPRGSTGPWPAGAAAELAGVLGALGGDVVVDAGAHRPDTAPELGAAGSSYLVVRPCYVALRRAKEVAGHADGVVLVVEPGRALGRREVEQVLGVPVVAAVELDPAVARAVDAGVLVRRPQRRLERALRDVA